MHIMLFDLWTHICLCLVDLASLVCRGLVILKKMLLMHVNQMMLGNSGRKVIQAWNHLSSNNIGDY